VPRTPEKPKIILVKTAEADLALVMKIKANDTIWGIANRFESPPSDRFIREIIELNQVDPYQLRIGQDLLVPLNEDVFQLVEVE
jgi:LysM repeat protein